MERAAPDTVVDQSLFTAADRVQGLFPSTSSCFSCCGPGWGPAFALRVPGRVFHRGLSREDARKDPDVEVDADGQQGLDVSLVDSGALVQTVEDDTKSLQEGRRRRRTSSITLRILVKALNHLHLESKAVVLDLLTIS